MRISPLWCVLALLAPLVASGCSSASNSFAWHRPNLQGWKWPSSKSNVDSPDTALANSSVQPTLPSSTVTPTAVTPRGGNTGPAPYGNYPDPAAMAGNSYPGQPASDANAAPYGSAQPYGPAPGYDPGYPTTGQPGGHIQTTPYQPGYAGGSGLYGHSGAEAAAYAAPYAAPYGAGGYPTTPYGQPDHSTGGVPAYPQTADARSSYTAAPGYSASGAGAAAGGSNAAGGYAPGYSTGSSYDIHPQNASVPAGPYSNGGGVQGSGTNYDGALPNRYGNSDTGYGSPNISPPGSGSRYADPVGAAQNSGRYPSTDDGAGGNEGPAHYMAGGDRYGMPRESSATSGSGSRYGELPSGPTSAPSTAPATHYRPGGTGDYIQPDSRGTTSPRTSSLPDGKKSASAPA